MRPLNHIAGRPGKPKLRLAMVFFAVLLLACASNLPLPLIGATSTPPLAAVEVTVVYLADQTKTAVATTPTSSPTPTATEILPIVDAVSPTSAMPVTDTPAFRPTTTLTPTNTVTPAPLSATSALTSPQTSVTANAPTGSPPGQQTPDGSITLLELPNNLLLPADVGRVEFKWLWNEVSVCTPPPEGVGFEVRIWPDLPGYGPVGVADAAGTQDKVICDPKSGTRSYEVGDLRNTPGVRAGGSGQFRWEVALIQLTAPFTQVAVSESRVFQLPPNPTIPTPAPTLVPRVTLPCPCEDVGGEIILIELQNEVRVPPADNTIEFKWRWTQASGCELPPPGYGFEVRIWPERPDFNPMGAMGDAMQSQGDIYCDPANGIRSYVVQDFHNAPGIKPAGAGRFRWDVILFKAEPYTEVIRSETRIFVLPGVSKLDQTTYD